MAKKTEYKGKRVDHHQIIAEQFASMIEEKGNLPWMRPFSGQRPRNLFAAEGVYYTGSNKLFLMLLDEPDPHYCTYNQARKAGGHVKKGAKSKKISFSGRKEYDKDTGLLLPPLPKDYTPEQKAIRDAKIDHSKTRRFLKTTPVFNAKHDCKGLEHLIPEPEQRPERTVEEGHEEITKAMKLVHEQIAPIVEVNSQPCYYPTLHKIGMPRPEKFHTIGSTHYMVNYLHVGMHEAAHATAHPDHLARSCVGKDGGGRDEAYAYEELVAEFAAHLTVSDMGFDTPEATDNSASYIQGWAKKIRSQPRAFVAASMQASYAAQYLMDVVDEIEPEKRMKTRKNEELRRELESLPKEVITDLVVESPEKKEPVSNIYIQSKMDDKGEHHIISYSDTEAMSPVEAEEVGEIINYELADDGKWHGVHLGPEDDHLMKSTEQGLLMLSQPSKGERVITEFRIDESGQRVEVWEFSSDANGMIKTEIDPSYKSYTPLPTFEDYEKPDRYVKMEMTDAGWSPLQSVDNYIEDYKTADHDYFTSVPVPQDKMWHQVPVSIATSTQCFARCSEDSIEVVTTEHEGQFMETDPFTRDLQVFRTPDDLIGESVKPAQIVELEHSTEKKVATNDPSRREPPLCTFKPLSSEELERRHKDFEHAISEINKEILVEVEVTITTEDSISSGV